jgi:hypothetical protein
MLATIQDEISRFTLPDFAKTQERFYETANSLRTTDKPFKQKRSSKNSPKPKSPNGKGKKDRKE